MYDVVPSRSLSHLLMGFVLVRATVESHIPIICGISIAKDTYRIINSQFCGPIFEIIVVQNNVKTHLPSREGNRDHVSIHVAILESGSICKRSIMNPLISAKSITTTNTIVR